MDFFFKYLAGINLLSFSLYFIDYLRFSLTGGLKEHWSICNIASVLGGAPGTLLAYICFDRRFDKPNRFRIVLAVCMLVLQAAACLAAYMIMNGTAGRTGTEGFLSGIQSLGREHMMFWYCLLGMNAVTALLFAADKYKAVKKRRRIPEYILLMMSFFGGSIGGLCAMHAVRHKTSSIQFSLGIPMMILTQTAVLILWAVLSL